VDGTATVGTSTRYARADHVHPTDTSRAPVASPTFTGTVTIPGSVAGVVKATAGGVLSQSTLVNADVSNSANIAPQKLQVAQITMWSAAAQTIATATTTQLGLSSSSQTGSTTYISYTNGSASGTTHTAGYVTVNYPCWVLVTAHIAWTNTTTGQRGMFIRHMDSASGVIDRPGLTIPAGAVIANTDLSYVMKCDTLDTIRLEGYQASGGNLGYAGNAIQEYSGTMLRVVVLGQQ
jgi:hypothetical protein